MLSSEEEIYSREVTTTTSFANIKLASVGLLALLGLPSHHSKIIAFQTPAAPIMEGIVDLHNDIMFFLTFIIVFVLYLLIAVAINFSDNTSYRPVANVTHNTTIEII